MHSFIFSLYFRMFIFFSWILISSQSQSISVDWQSSTNLSSIAFQFLPINPQALILFELHTTSLITCTQTCHSTSRCRIFDFDDQSKWCRLFEGNIITMGSIIASSSNQSRVGSIKLYYKQFISRGQSCSSCQGSRYLRCVNNTCECEVNTYFDGYICQSQKLLGSSCNNNTECRIDLNYTCLPRQQCGPLSLQSGTLVGGYGNGTAGNTLDGLNNPSGLFVNKNESLYVSDMKNNRVVKLRQGSLIATVIAGTGSPGSGTNQLDGPSELAIDASSNIYVSDGNNRRVMFWRKNASTGILIAGTGVTGCTPSTLALASGLAIDSLGNIYVSDCYNHRIMKWAPNATNGTNIAGTCVGGTSNQQLKYPTGIHLDELNSYIYIADSNNHRIQRYQLGDPMNGTTVAGGNGQGSGMNQLDTPYSVYVSIKTGFIYIADYNNHRIQRWSLGGTYGVTIAGTTAISGTSLTLLNNPSRANFNSNETYMYVNDMNNNRILRFTLI